MASNRTTPDPLANLSKDLGKDIPGGLPGSVSPEPGQTVPSLQQINDIHDHLVRLQIRVNEQAKMIEDLQLSLQESAPTGTSSFENKVWEAVMLGAVQSALKGVIQDTPKAMQQIVDKAIRLADNGVKAAKLHQIQQEKNRQAEETAKNNDPLKNLIGSV